MLGAVAGTVEESRYREEHAKGATIDPGHQVLASTSGAFKELNCRKHGWHNPNPVCNHIGHLLDLLDECTTNIVMPRLTTDT